ncbi:MAG: hypothetical protein WBB23_01430 [Desulforhopalus sp.]
MDEFLLHREAFLFLKKKASDLFFILSAKGIIIETNQAAERLIGRCLIGERFQDILTSREKTLALEEVTTNPEKEIMLHIDNALNLSQSYYFTFKKIAECVVVFGRLDSEEIEISRNEMISLNQELNNLSRKLHKKNAELNNALNQIKTLQGILPICMHCHRIRNDKANWDQLEAYIEKQTEAQFSHSICPDCLDKHYPEDVVESKDE